MLERDHPVIENLMRTGYPTRERPESPVCPVCQERCSEIYVDGRADVVGCDNCVHSTTPDDVCVHVNGDDECGACGNPCDTIYVSDMDGFIGCENCVHIEDAWTHKELYQPE